MRLLAFLFNLAYLTFHDMPPESYRRRPVANHAFQEILERGSVPYFAGAILSWIMCKVQSVYLSGHFADFEEVKLFG